MSEEDAKAFLKKVGEDKELQEKLKGADSEEKFLAVAKAAGFDFTKEEWLAVIPKPKDGELTDADLGAVAGGHNFTNYCGDLVGAVACSLWNDEFTVSDPYTHKC
ncbi:MAG: Nif11-like leader peptide family natural product precursor [Planctomycetota bacterium]|nr:Nif11-like leader peptide family natural product precursor [Planctomycetota bacterium]